MDGLNRPYRRDRTTALAYLFNSSQTGFQVAFGATMPVIRDDLNISLTLASLHFTVMAVCGMIGSNFASIVAGALGRRKSTILSLTVACACLFVICFAPSVVFTLPACAFLGMFAPLGTIITQSELMDHHIAHRSAALADLNVVVSVAMLATILGIGPLVELTDSWRLALLLPATALCTTFLAVRSLHFTDARRGARMRTRQSMSGLAWLFCVLVMSQTAFEWSYGYLGAEFLDRAGGLSKERAAATMALYYAGLVIGRIGLVPMVRAFSSYRLLIGSYAVAISGFLLLAGGPTTWIKLTGLFVSGLGISITFPMIINLAGAAFPEATTWIIGKIYVAGGLAVAIAPFGIGTLGDSIGIGSSFWVLGLIGLIGLAASPFLNRFLNEQATGRKVQQTGRVQASN